MASKELKTKTIIIDSQGVSSVVVKEPSDALLERAKNLGQAHKPLAVVQITFTNGMRLVGVNYLESSFKESKRKGFLSLPGFSVPKRDAEGNVATKEDGKADRNWTDYVDMPAEMTKVISDAIDKVLDEFAAEAAA